MSGVFLSLGAARVTCGCGSCRRGFMQGEAPGLVPVGGQVAVASAVQAACRASVREGGCGRQVQPDPRGRDAAARSAECPGCRDALRGALSSIDCLGDRNRLLLPVQWAQGPSPLAIRPWSLGALSFCLSQAAFLRSGVLVALAVAGLCGQL